MDKPRKTSAAPWIIAALIVGTIAIAAGVLVNSSKKNQTTQSDPTTGTSSTDNLKLQNECIANAQATDESNPVYYSTLAVGEQPAGWTLAGQEHLQSQIADCKSQYPTN